MTDEEYEAMADAQEHPTREEDKAAEIALDVAQDERLAEEERQAATAEVDNQECNAEFIDGSYTYCGCWDCQLRENEERDEAEDEADY